MTSLGGRGHIDSLIAIGHIALYPTLSDSVRKLYTFNCCVAFNRVTRKTMLTNVVFLRITYVYRLNDLSTTYN